MGKPVARRTKAAGAPEASRDGAKAAKTLPQRDARGCFVPSGTRIVAVEGAGEAARPARPARSKAAPVRWSAKRQAIFLATLAETANITQSARAAKISPTTVRRKRRDSADFRALWDGALREGVAQLKMQLLDRALNGVEETVWHGGKKVGSVVRFNDRLALALIAAHEPKGDPIEPGPRVPIEELRERLKAKLSEMNRRMGGAG